MNFSINIHIYTYIHYYIFVYIYKSVRSFCITPFIRIAIALYTCLHLFHECCNGCVIVMLVFFACVEHFPLSLNNFLT